MICDYGCAARMAWVRRTETCDNANNFATVSVVYDCGHTLPDDQANYTPVGEGESSQREALAEIAQLRAAGYVVGDLPPRATPQSDENPWAIAAALEGMDAGPLLFEWDPADLDGSHICGQSPRKTYCRGCSPCRGAATEEATRRVRAARARLGEDAPIEVLCEALRAMGADGK